MTLPHSDVVIGIPTYRRPALLGILLKTLAPELSGSGVKVIVADNDCGTEAPAVVSDQSSSFWHIECLPVHERGVSQVRNAIVAAADRCSPGWRCLIMLDDDGRVTPGWLVALLKTASRFGADLVGGPVEGELPDRANLLARHSLFARRRRWPTGVVSSLNTTQNLLISCSAVDKVGRPLFRNDYGASGGEDYDLFRRVARAGGVLAWCDEAVVIEPAPADRLTHRALLSRYATTGAYMSLIDASYDGRWTVALRAVKGLLASLVRAAWRGLRLDGPEFAVQVLMVAHFLGRLAGLAGARTSRYVKAETV